MEKKYRAGTMIEYRHKNHPAGGWERAKVVKGNHEKILYTLCAEPTCRWHGRIWHGRCEEDNHAKGEEIKKECILAQDWAARALAPLGAMITILEIESNEIRKVKA